MVLERGVNLYIFHVKKLYKKRERENNNIHSQRALFPPCFKIIMCTNTNVQAVICEIFLSKRKKIIIIT